MGKIIELLQIDRRGRIVIPQLMRRALGLKDGSPVLVISEADEMRITPLLEHEPGTHLVNFHITMPDKPGALAKIAQVFADLQISLIHDESMVINKGQQAEWHVTAAIGNIDLTQIITQLKTKGEAVAVGLKKLP